MGRKIALASASLLSLACADAAWAQDGAPANAAAGMQNAASAADGESGGIEDIIVTATRQATNLQDTPVAVTAVTSEALEDRGIVTIGELTSVVPNSQFRKAQGVWGSGVSANIRGIGSNDTGLAGNPPIAFYIDDVYYPLLLGANFDLLDMDHIEVLRGPQGTLFGRNSLGGAINIVAKQPNPDDASGYVDVTTGSYDRIDVRAGVNLPIGENAALLISGTAKRQEGYQKILDFTCEMNRKGTPALAGRYPFTTPLQNTTSTMNVDDCEIDRKGGTDLHGGRAALMWEFTPGVRFTVTADYMRDLSDYAADSLIALNTTIVNRNTASMNDLRSQAAYFGLQVDSRFLTDPYSSYSTYEDKIPACTVIPGNRYYTGAVNERGQCTRGGYVIPRHIDLTNWGISAKLNWEITNNINLTAVYAHRDLEEFHGYDTDGLPLVSEHTYLNLRNPYDQAEVRLSGTSSFIDWLVGGFYYHAPAEQRATLIQPVSAGAQRLLHTYFTSDSKAVFANVTVRPFGEKLGINLGGRYSDEVMDIDFSNIADTSWQNSGSDIVFTQKLTAKKFSWKAGVSYQPDDDLLFYASAATGYTLPGYNSRPQQKTQIYQTLAASNIAYELGAKLDLFDRRLRLNMAAFYTDFKNRPSTINGAEATLDSAGNIVVGNQRLDPLPGGPEGSTMCSPTLVPAGTGIVCASRAYPINTPAKIRGVEAEFTAEPIDNLVFNGSLGWSKFTSPDIKARVANRRQQNPFWTASAGVQYTVDVPMIDGSIIPRIDMTYESDQTSGSTTNTTFNYLLKARTLFNGRLTYNNDSYDFSLALGVTNLFDKFYWVNIFDYSGGGTGTLPQTNGQPSMPRTWSLTLSKRF